ncbi:unnamed protein product [Calypogeia fissa]
MTRCPVLRRNPRFSSQARPCKWLKDGSGICWANRIWRMTMKIPKAVELEARPPRLGLGAKYLPHSKVTTTMSPVEKKLRAMTGAGKQQQRDGGHHIGKRNLSASTPAKESQSDSESDEEEEEVKGSSRIRHGRQQRRIGSADLLLKVSGSKGRGSKRKR